MIGFELLQRPVVCDTQTAVTLGWWRDDGDFEVVVTFRAGPLVIPRQFELAVDAITIALKQVLDFEPDVLEYSPAPTLVHAPECDPTTDAILKRITVDRSGSDMYVSIVDTTTSGGDDDYFLYATVRGGEFLTPWEFYHVIGTVEQQVRLCNCTLPMLLKRSDAPETCAPAQ